MNKLFLIGGISALCIACSVGPDYQPPKIYNDGELSENLLLTPYSKAKISHYWYRNFGDENLNQFIDLGLKNSPNIKTAKENLKQARYQLYINQAGFLPFFDAKGEYSKSNQNLAGAFPVDSDFYQVGADATWEIDIWGGQRRLNESSLALLEATASDFDNVKISLIAEIANQYIGWKSVEKQITLTEKNINFQKEIFENEKIKYQSGLSDDLTFEQAKSLLSSTQMQLPALKAKEKAYQNALAVLIGVLPDKITKSSENLLDKKPAFDLSLLHDLPAEIIRNRPDVKSAERKLASENALIGNRLANLFPSLSLSAFLGYQNNTLAPIFAPDFNMYSNQALVSLPILHWGELVNNVKIQKSKTRQAFNLYQSAILTAVSDISNAIKSVEEEVKRNEYSHNAMKSSRNVSELSLKKYQNGLTDFSDVLTAEKNKISAENEYIASNAQVYLNIISFYKSIGGGLASNQDNRSCRANTSNKTD